MSLAGLAKAYSHPGFAPVPDELSGVALRIRGDLPAELDGVFLRNGPNALFPGRRPHMFDGEAMLHVIELRGGEARYSNALVRTPRTRYIEESGRNPFLGVGDLAGGGKQALLRLILQRWKTRLGLLRSFAPLEAVAGGTSVLCHDDRLYCLQETGLPFALDVDHDAEGWLRIDGNGHLENFGGGLSSPFSAHPKTDMHTGEVHSIGHDILSGTTRHTVVSPGGMVRNAVVATARPPAFFVHDFVVTERFVVFPDSSLRFDPAGLVRAGSVAAFDRDRPLRFGVIGRDHRDGDAVRWFETRAPGHIWHIANVWEQDGEILIHAPVFGDYPATMPIHTPAEPHARFVRWRLDLASGSVAEETVLLDHFYERPGIDVRRAGTPSRFAWLLDEGRGGVMGKGVLKYDMIDAREAGYIDYGELHGGEPLFVPRAAGKDEVDGGREDDGWLIDLLSDGSNAALVVVDAATMIERCRIDLPRRVPFGVHGLWIDRADADRLVDAS